MNGGLTPQDARLQRAVREVGEARHDASPDERRSAARHLRQLAEAMDPPADKWIGF